MVAADADNVPIELGVKFFADTNGSISGIRFFKSTTNTGTHVASLWTANGTRLAQATFTVETPSGWQQVNFATPVVITAGTHYVASYHTNVGHYAADTSYLANGFDNPPLHALKDGADGGNGVYAYSANSIFPTNTYKSSNYWVDVVFAPTGGGTDTTPPTVSARTPAPNATGVALSTPVSATFSEAVQQATISFTLKDASTNTVLAALSYNNTTFAATLTPNAALAAATTYTATLSGAKDSAGNTMSTVSWSFTTASAQVSCPCTIWPSTATPVVAADPDSVGTEVGVRFRVDSNGFISAIRYYKSTTNTGTHVASLWTSSGTLLARATFANETPSGWQQVNFAAPVAISAATTYVASYHTNSGHYAGDTGFFANAGVDNGPLHALKDGLNGANGVYSYNANSVFPTSTYKSGNYWVDVVFNTSANDTTAPVVTTRSPIPNASGVALSTPVSATFSEAVQQATINFTLKDASNATVPATLSYSNATFSATLTPNATLAASTTYTATLSGAKDSAGNTMSALSWSFTTASAQVSCPCTIWPSTATPVVAADPDSVATEVGVRFSADSNGSITGIRYYKSSTNTGTHVASLWTSTGTLLARATFANETPSGWQQVNFASPVAISAGTTYVASYHTNSGHYAGDTGFFANAGVDNAPLHALKDGLDGRSGVYSYNANSVFPTSTYKSTNYWVDVVFSSP